MSNATISILVTENYSDLVTCIKDRSFLSTLKLMKSTSIGTFDFLKNTMSLLTTLCDLEVKFSHQSILSNLKEVVKGLIEIMIDPLVSDLKKSQTIAATPEDETKAQILSKWWLTYLSLLTQAFEIKKRQALWGSSKMNWFLPEECKALKESLEALENFYHWKMTLLRGCLLFTRPGQIVESFMNKASWKSQFNEI